MVRANPSTVDTLTALHEAALAAREEDREEAEADVDALTDLLPLARTGLLLAAG